MLQNEAVVKFISDVWQDLGRSEKLYPGSPAMFHGGGIQDLLGAMRPQHSKTLTYYLQEITAESILSALGARCGEKPLIASVGLTLSHESSGSAHGPTCPQLPLPRAERVLCWQLQHFFSQSWTACSARDERPHHGQLPNE